MSRMETSSTGVFALIGDEDGPNLVVEFDNLDGDPPSVAAVDPWGEGVAVQIDMDEVKRLIHALNEIVARYPATPPATH